MSNSYFAVFRNRLLLRLLTQQFYGVKFCFYSQKYYLYQRINKFVHSNHSKSRPAVQGIYMSQVPQLEYRSESSSSSRSATYLPVVVRCGNCPKKAWQPPSSTKYSRFGQRRAKSLASLTERTWEYSQQNTTAAETWDTEKMYHCLRNTSFYRVSFCLWLSYEQMSFIQTYSRNLPSHLIRTTLFQQLIASYSEVYNYQVINQLINTINHQYLLIE
ncbi:Hypothetical_protein [Hexamita inflata]|uniref:Hypothetical_protein n=1 Tax=Hexamita inflata TaxID=28002 RepID=A0AA86PC38_9EUKA|nr:Hypothetical protein HINF_LOCUS23532 [Hexamita inflata]